jgi:hypothetical protein
MITKSLTIPVDTFENVNVVAPESCLVNTCAELKFTSLAAC